MHIAIVVAVLLAAPFTALAQTACPNISRTLSYGSRGSDVVQLQRFLITSSFLAAGNDTGFFGKLTQAAVQAYQRSKAIVSSGTPATTGYGVVGPKTRAAVQACGTNAKHDISSLQAQINELQQKLQLGYGLIVEPPPKLQPAPDLIVEPPPRVKADGVTDDYAALQSLVGECAGGIVRLPAGKIKISRGIALTKGCTIEGVGADGSIESVANPTGTAIVSTNPEQSVFYITTPASVTIRDLGIFMPTGSSAVGIFIQPAAQPVYGSNSGSRIERVRVHGGGGGMTLVNAKNFTIRDSVISDFATHGIKMTLNGGVTDLGDALISGNTIWDFQVTSGTAGIWLDPAAAVHVIGNKILGASYGVYLTVSTGPTGTLIIDNNSIEAQNTDGIRVMQTKEGAAYSNITINANQFGLGDPAAGSNIAIFPSGFDDAPYLRNIVITNNVINNTITRAIPFISVSEGDGVIIKNNIINGTGHVGPVGIQTDYHVKNGIVGGNVGVDLPSGVYGTLGPGTTREN